MYVYIGSLGLLCYDFAGREVWRRRLATPKTMFGSGTSPVVAGDVVLLNRDDSTRPLRLAIDRHTGGTAWESSEDDGAENQFRAAYATPVRWGSHWLVHPSGSVAAYSDQGELRWSLPTATGGASTPVVAADALVVGAWTNLGESDRASRSRTSRATCRPMTRTATVRLRRTRFSPTTRSRSDPNQREVTSPLPGCSADGTPTRAAR